MSSSPSAERFHALDATRAFALMLGVVFHAAWSFVPRHMGAAIVDHSGSVAFDWFFFTSHSFRMQVFFLIAGFFARMLYHKRGWRGFTRHRLARIAVPLVVGWFILFPLVFMMWVWGGNRSGGNMPPLPIPVFLDLAVAKGLMFAPRNSGGLFSLLHLWFLYYLLWIYLVAILGRALLIRVLPNGARPLLDRVAAHIAGSPWAVAWLALLTGLFLWRMEGWTGVDTPIATLVPSGPVMLLYGSFFVLGWLWHRQTALLQTLARHWKWQLAAGLAVSLACFAGMTRLLERGYVSGTLLMHYPGLTPNQISDAAKFVATLKSAEAPGAPAELASLWQHLPPPTRAAVAALPADPRPDAINGVCNAINGLLSHPALFAAGSTPAASPAALDAPRLRMQNRTTLERLFGGALNGNPSAQPSYFSLKLVYSLGYALMTWLLVLGTLGIFQALCQGHSAAWRYVADSAYWIYLAHLPLVAALQVWMAAWPLPGALKFPLLLAIAFAVLFASYHYLVRSTFIGRALNGQSYPFTPWPFAAPPPSMPATAGVATARAGE